MNNEVELKSLVPQIIEEGKTVVRPDVIQAVTQLAQLGQLVKIRKSLEKEEYEGILDQRTLASTDATNYIDLINSHPYKPWIDAYFYNDGANEIYIAINRPVDFHRIEPTESLALDFSNADRRIELIYYRCDPGETTSVRALGKY